MIVDERADLIGGDDAFDVRRKDLEKIVEAALLGVGPEGSEGLERGVDDLPAVGDLR